MTPAAMAEFARVADSVRSAPDCRGCDRLNAVICDRARRTESMIENVALDIGDSPHPGDHGIKAAETAAHETLDKCQETL